MEIIISCLPTGEVNGLHHDDFPLMFLGKAKVHRVSEIVFVEKTQKWSVSFLHCWVKTLNVTFSTYRLAREFEVDVINACTKQDISIDSEECLEVALAVYTSGRYGVIDEFNGMVPSL